MYHSIKY